MSARKMGARILLFITWSLFHFLPLEAQAVEERHEVTSIITLGDPYSFTDMNYRGDPLQRLPVYLDQGPYHDLVADVAGQYGMDPALIKAMIKVESGYDPKAVSVKGAKGLMQLMPGTAKSLGVNEAFDPAENIAAGVKYLNRLKETFNGDTILALAAYHSGEGSVLKYRSVPPYKSTQKYIYRVLYYWAYIKGRLHSRISSTSPATRTNP